MNEELDENEVELAKEYALALSIIKKLEEVSFSEADVEEAERYAGALWSIKAAKK